jgi:hypothetical protein
LALAAVISSAIRFVVLLVLIFETLLIIATFISSHIELTYTVDRFIVTGNIERFGSSVP